MSETTIINLNPDLWKLLLPESVPDWIRNMVANRLATSGEEWADVYSKECSYTYNNQFSVVNWLK